MVYKEYRFCNSIKLIRYRLGMNPSNGAQIRLSRLKVGGSFRGGSEHITKKYIYKIPLLLNIIIIIIFKFGGT